MRRLYPMWSNPKVVMYPYLRSWEKQYGAFWKLANCPVYRLTRPQLLKELRRLIYRLRYNDHYRYHYHVHDQATSNNWSWRLIRFHQNTTSSLLYVIQFYRLYEPLVLIWYIELKFTSVDTYTRHLVSKINFNPKPKPL